MKDSEVLTAIKNSSKQSNIPFGVAIIFMGLTFLPREYSASESLTISLLFLVLGAWVIFGTVASEGSAKARFTKYVVSVLAGIGIGILLCMLFLSGINII